MNSTRSVEEAVTAVDFVPKYRARECRIYLVYLGGVDIGELLLTKDSGWMLAGGIRGQAAVKAQLVGGLIWGDLETACRDIRLRLQNALGAK